MPMYLAKPEHEVLFQDLVDLVGKHKEKMDAKEMLAVAANMLGKIIALQDQRTMNPNLAMKIVAANIECGNKQVFDQLAKTLGNA